MCRASTSAQTHKQSGDNKEAGKPKERGKWKRDIKARWTAHRHTHVTNPDSAHTSKRNTDADSGKRDAFRLRGQEDDKSKIHSPM